MSVITLQDIRDEGVTLAMASDAKVLTYIDIAQTSFEGACGQWFEARPYAVTFDGKDVTVEFFQVPIIEVSELADLDDPDNIVVIEPENYRVYNGRNAITGDDRRNPKIAMIDGYRFLLGRQRYRVTGTFGFLDENDQAPRDVWLALLRYTIELLLTPNVLTSQSILNAQLIPNGQGLLLTEEVTDDHKQKWSKTTSLQKSNINSALTNDPFVQNVMLRYRNPIKIGTQTNWERLDVILDEVVFTT